MRKSSAILRHLGRSPLFAVIIFVSLPCWGQFRDKRDRDIVKDVVKTFGRACTLRVAADSDIIKKIQSEAEASRKSSNKEVQKCFERNLSQISGVNVLFSRICAQAGGLLASSKTPSDNSLARLLVQISQYQTGIRPFQSTLNDCLLAVPDGTGQMFVVPTASSGLKFDNFGRAFDETRMNDPYAFTAEPFR